MTLLLVSVLSLGTDAKSSSYASGGKKTMAKTFGSPESALEALADAIQTKTGITCSVDVPWDSGDLEIGYVGGLRCGSAYYGDFLGQGSSWSVQCMPSVYSSEESAYRVNTIVFPVLDSQLFMTFEGGTNQLLKGSRCTKAMQKFVGSTSLPNTNPSPPLSALVKGFLGDQKMFLKRKFSNPKLAKNAVTYSYVSREKGRCFAVFFKTEVAAKNYQRKQKKYKFGSYSKIRGSEFDIWVATDQQLRSSKCTLSLRTQARFNTTW